MGKRLRAQRRGKGSFTFMATKNAKADVHYIVPDEHQLEGILRGQVVDLVTDKGRTGILARILFEDGQREFVVAAEGIMQNQWIEYGNKADLQVGNVLPIKMVPEGCPIFAVERHSGDGGTLIRSAGLYGIVMSKDRGKAFIRLPSGKSVTVEENCRATIGCVAGGGRKDKPFMKAGARFFYMKKRRHHYPGIRGVAMNAVDHPFGGSQHHAGKSKSTSRNAPPGRKVGAIASSRTGRKKKN
ncbi:MAG: 50S ribosomal protein L2 [Candidatus Micrarchaeota archaeon]